MKAPRAQQWSSGSVGHCPLLAAKQDVLASKLSSAGTCWQHQSDSLPLQSVTAETSQKGQHHDHLDFHHPCELHAAVCCTNCEYPSQPALGQVQPSNLPPLQSSLDQASVTLTVLVPVLHSPSNLETVHGQSMQLATCVDLPLRHAHQHPQLTWGANQSLAWIQMPSLI